MSDPAGPTIREAMPDDAQAIAAVHVASWRTTYRGIMSDAVLGGLSVERRAATWRAMLDAPAARSFILVAEDALAGIIGFVSAGSERDGDPVYSGEIYAIYLLAPAQRRGVGRRLMTEAALRLAAAGMPAFRLWVAADNHPGRRFYEAMGGAPIAERTVQIGGADLREVAYGWRAISPPRPLPCIHPSG